MRLHSYQEDLSALRGFPPAEIVKAWESLGAPLSEASKKRLADMDQQVLIDIAADRVNRAARLRNIQTRGLLVCGTEDWRFEDTRRFAQENTCYRFVSVQGTDHLQTWLRPEQVLPPVVEFLRESAQ